MTCFMFSCAKKNNGPAIVGDIGRQIPRHIALIVGRVVRCDVRGQKAGESAWKAIKAVGTGGKRRVAGGEIIHCT